MVVGVEIRVIGNDAGEKLSILSGFISRLDRNAPEYGEGYNDFNTCYYQANAAASGGSSGSPVVMEDASAIALQASGRFDGASTAYFLPLDRPLRALKCIQQRKPITRGDIQCHFLLKPFDECRRLGVDPYWEATVRRNFPTNTSMLVAEAVLPDGPSHGKIQEGDVLIRLNKEFVIQFVRLDELLDASVGKSMKLELLRRGRMVEVEVEVGDLHKITPDRFIRIAGASFHELSYQQARLYGVAVKGVFVCEAAGSFKFEAERGWVLQTVNGKKIPDLGTFIQIMKVIPDKARIVVTYRHLNDPHTLKTDFIKLDRHWSSEMEMAVRNDNTGLWDFVNLAEPLPPKPSTPRSGYFTEIESMSQPNVAGLARSFVRINCTLPMSIDGFPKSECWGMGLVLDAAMGLVLVSRAVVPYDLCSLTVVVADSIYVDGSVVFLHPLQNYAVIKYDPSLIDAPVKSAVLSCEKVIQGSKTYFVGYTSRGRIVHGSATVTEVVPVAIPSCSVPRYRASYVDGIAIDSNLASSCNSGALLAADGSVQALWISFLGDGLDEYYLGLGSLSFLPVIASLRNAETPTLRILLVGFQIIQMTHAFVLGVPDKWIERVRRADHFHHRLFMVCKHTSERICSPSTLLEGDILLTLNDKICTQMSDFDSMYTNEVLDAVVYRQGKELHLKLLTIAANDLETNHVVKFCGAILHRPHHAVRQQISYVHSEIYVSGWTLGSPADQYGLAPTNFITHVNGKATCDLASFVTETRRIPDNACRTCKKY